MNKVWQKFVSYALFIIHMAVCCHLKFLFTYHSVLGSWNLVNLIMGQRVGRTFRECRRSQWPAQHWSLKRRHTQRGARRPLTVAQSLHRRPQASCAACTVQRWQWVTIFDPWPATHDYSRVITPDYCSFLCNRPLGLPITHVVQACSYVVKWTSTHEAEGVNGRTAKCAW